MVSVIVASIVFWNTFLICSMDDYNIHDFLHSRPCFKLDPSSQWSSLTCRLIKASNMACVAAHNKKWQDIFILFYVSPFFCPLPFLTYCTAPFMSPTCAVLPILFRCAVWIHVHSLLEPPARGWGCLQNARDCFDASSAAAAGSPFSAALYALGGNMLSGRLGDECG